MRRKDDTLQATLLEHAQQLADAEGIGAVNIRTIAQRAGVAAGTVYNYFASKDDILLALTEAYWRQTLQAMRAVITASTFYGQLEEIYAFLRGRIDHSAGTLMGSLGNVEAAGQARMSSMQATLEAALVKRMDQDPAIRQDVWDETFTKDQFVRFIMLNLMALLRTKSPDVGFLIAMIKRTIY